MDWGSPAVSGGLAALITPLVMRALIWLFPPTPKDEFAQISSEALRMRNTWIDNVAAGILLLGLLAGVGYYMTGTEPHDPLGAAIGGAIAGLGPFAFILVMTVGSKARLREYMYFCEVEYRISRTGLALILAPLLFVGLVSLLYLGHRAAI